MFRGLSVALAAMVWTSPAAAEWHEAVGPHFIVYSDESEDRVRTITQRLERLDAAVRLVRNMDDPARSPATKVTVYIVPSVGTVQRLASTRFAAGFYNAQVEGPIAVVPRRSGSGDYDLNPQTILFHEYAHHLFLSDLDHPIPLWLSEGFAEFFATVDFDSNGGVTLGRGATHRFLTFAFGPDLSLERMMAGEAKGDELSTLYAQGWLLTHYLAFNQERRGQLDGYLKDIAAGIPPVDAAKKNFGSLRKLEGDLRFYLDRKSHPVVKLGPELIKPIPIQVRTLSPGAAAVMPWRIESKAGVDDKEAAEVVAEVRRIARSYPNDPMVLLTLAEAEIDARNPAASEAAADALLKIDSQSVDAMIFKGRAIMGRADAAGGNKAEAYKTARSWFISANKTDKEDPEPLAYFYRSYVQEGAAPTRNAAAALHYASNLMPQDDEIRIESALQYARDNQLAEAGKTLSILAYSAHQDERAQMVRAMMAKLAAGDGKGAIAIAEEARKKAEEAARKSSAR